MGQIIGLAIGGRKGNNYAMQCTGTGEVLQLQLRRLEEPPRLRRTRLCLILRLFSSPRPERVYVTFNRNRSDRLLHYITSSRLRAAEHFLGLA